MADFTTGEIIAILGIVGGVGGFTVGLYQYHVAQKWKKSEFAANLLERLANDERLATCCKLLDWSTRKLPVPDQYILLTDETTFMHDWEKLTLGMAPETKKGSFDWQEMLYRDLFDYFFDYLERVNHYISIRLITCKEVQSLAYWLEQLASPRFVENSVFMDFIREYEYSGVLELMDKFGIDYSKG